MNPAQFFSHFDRLSETPDAIPKLRRFILGLAVRGKLVEQELSDEPASELLKRIQVEKARLVRSGDIRRQVGISQVEETEFPFEIPASWRWVRLIDVLTKLTDGTHHSPTNLTDGDFKYITAKNIKPEGVSLADISYVTAKVHHEIYARCNPEKGDILYIKDGATTGIVTINDLDEPFSMLSSVALLKLSTGVYNRLIAEFLRSPFFYMQMRGFMKGAAITRVTLKRMAPALVPLPPFAEQHRIVAKVDELMAQCDRLEAAQAERESRRDRLAAASLHRLNQPADDASAFREHARFYFNHLRHLTTRPEHINQLRQTILNLAVRGQLVSQDLTDEPASELLKRIQADRARLVKEGAVRKRNPTSLGDRDARYDLPMTWRWELLGNVITQMDSGWSPECEPKPRVSKTDWGILKTTAVQKLSFDDRQHKALPAKLKPRPEYEANAGDILITRAGPKNRVGICCLVEVVEKRLMISDKIIRFHLFSGLEPRFIALALNAGYSLQAIENSKSGMAVMQMNISQEKLKVVPIPIPPLAEQHRIVAKVQEVLALCDRLECQITTIQTESRGLIEAILHNALVSAA
ncbi:restriction endonuclease subunit S [Nitrospira sp. Nam74]